MLVFLTQKWLWLTFGVLSCSMSLGMMPQRSTSACSPTWWSRTGGGDSTYRQSMSVPASTASSVTCPPSCRPLAGSPHSSWGRSCPRGRPQLSRSLISKTRCSPWFCWNFFLCLFKLSYCLCIFLKCFLNVHVLLIPAFSTTLLVSCPFTDYTLPAQIGSVGQLQHRTEAVWGPDCCGSTSLRFCGSVSTMVYYSP